MSDNWAELQECSSLRDVDPTCWPFWAILKGASWPGRRGGGFLGRQRASSQCCFVDVCSMHVCLQQINKRGRWEPPKQMPHLIHGFAFLLPDVGDLGGRVLVDNSLFGVGGLKENSVYEGTVIFFLCSIFSYGVAVVYSVWGFSMLGIKTQV